MSKWTASQEDKEAAAGALLILGAMLFEWGLPLGKALDGLRRAYEMEGAKQVKACICNNPRDIELCENRNHCADVRAFVRSIRGRSDG